MGQMCITKPHYSPSKQEREKEHQFRSTSSFFEYENDFKSYQRNKRNSFENELRSLKYFIQEDGYLPELFKVKYMNQLLDIKNRLQVKMLEHSDKYNGYCNKKEQIVQVEYKAQQNIVLTDCREGMKFNEQMILIGNYLIQLGYYDNEDNKTVNICLIQADGWKL